MLYSLGIKFVFRQNANGETVFYPWGLMSKRGYVIPSEDYASKLNNLVIWHFIASVLLLVIVPKYIFPNIGFEGFCALVFTCFALYGVIIHTNTKGLRTTTQQNISPELKRIMILRRIVIIMCLIIIAIAGVLIIFKPGL